MEGVTTINEAWQFAGELMMTRTDVVKHIFAVDYPEMVFEKYSVHEAYLDKAKIWGQLIISVFSR